MTVIVIVAFAAHIVAWLALPSGKKTASVSAPIRAAAGINVSHA